MAVRSMWTRRPITAPRTRDTDYTQTRVQSYAATLTHRFNDNWSLRNATRYYHYTLNRNNTLPGSVNEAARTVSLTHGNVLRDEHGWTNQTELMQRVQWGSVRHDMLYGIEVGQQNKDLLNWSAANVAVVDLFDPRLPTLQRQVSGAPGSDSLGRFNTLGLYVQDMMSLGEHWKVLAGVRHDRFEQETEDRRSGRNLSRTDSNFSPRLGLVFQPDSVQSYYVSWSRSYQPSGETFALAANNVDLAPEKTTNYEVGAKYDFLDGKLDHGVGVPPGAHRHQGHQSGDQHAGAGGHAAHRRRRMDPVGRPVQRLARDAGLCLPGCA